MTTVPSWEHFAHDADIGVHGIGATPDEAFEQAALALTAVVADPATVAPETVVETGCEADDPGLLLVEWLNALVYEMAVRRMLFSRHEVEIAGNTLQARSWGETIDPGRHQPVVEVKGATYTALDVGMDADGIWHARCVVDV